MFQHRSSAHRVPIHALAILAAALVACGSVTGAGSAGTSTIAGSDIPSAVRLTEFEYESQGAAPRMPAEVRVNGTSDAGSADIYLIP